MKRILFVDDEPRVLDGLRRMLHPYRREWSMSFATTGGAALDVLASMPVDVIVSDMRMPSMDGLTLLTTVRERFPSVVRVILSGHTELETALRAVPVAHQFLAKPSDARTVREVVERACKLHGLVQDDAIRAVLGGIDTLPAIPRVYAELTQALANDDAGLGEVAAIVERDASLTSKMLQITNAPFFGLTRPASTIQAATNHLGVEVIKNLVIAVEVFRTFRSDVRIEGFSLEAEQAHALRTAQIARRLLEPARADEAFTAAILHDVGTLILAQHFPELLAEVLRLARAERTEPWRIERRLRGVTHAEMGAYLLHLWGLPFPIIEAVGHHHEPQAVATRTFELPAALYLADRLADHVEGETGTPCPALDTDYLRSVGVADRLPEWMAMAAGEEGARP